MNLVVLKTSNIVVELNVVFGFNMKFLNNNFDKISNNIPIFEKIFSFIKYGGMANNKALKNFIKFMIMSGEKYHLISGFNDLAAFGIGYNKAFGFIDFKSDILGFNKGLYCKVLRNSYTKGNCLMLNIKSPHVDINNRYYIIPDEIYQTVFREEAVNPIFDRVMIKTFKLHSSRSRGIPQSTLYFEFNQYKNKVKINHEEYYNEDNNYIRYLVNIFFDYYNNGNTTFEAFIEFLEHEKGIRTYNDFKKEYKDQVTIEEFIEHENTIQHGNDLINLVFYLQTINFIENNLKGHDRKLRNIKELQEKKLRFNKDIILFIFKDINSRDLNKLREFLKTL